MTNTFSTIDTTDLSTITGGAAPSKVLLNDLDKRFDSDGVVSLIGKPKFSSTGTAGVDKVSGKFDVNALWGGDTKYSFKGATLNTNTGGLTGLHPKAF